MRHRIARTRRIGAIGAVEIGKQRIASFRPMKPLLNIVRAKPHPVRGDVTGSAVSPIRSQIFKEWIVLVGINFPGGGERGDEASWIKERQKVRDNGRRHRSRQNQQDHYRQSSAYSETRNSGHKL